MRSPEGMPLYGLVCAYIGPPEDAEPHWQRLRELGSPLVDTLGPRTWLEIQSMLEGPTPPGMRHYWKAEYVPGVDAQLAGVLVEAMLRAPSPETLIVIVPTWGAQTRVPVDATAFPHRNFAFQVIITGQCSTPDLDQPMIDWTREVWEELLPWAVGGVYVNDLTEEEVRQTDRVRHAYGQNYDRLTRIKAVYDPDNFFHVNANIEPAPHVADPGA
jgi:hypothetical protein